MNAELSTFYLLLVALAIGLLIGAAMNNLLKALMAGLIGGRELAIKTSLPLLISAVVGILLTLILQTPF